MCERIWTPPIAGLGAAFYGLCNAAVRFPGDRMRTLFGDMPLMIGSLSISIIGFVSLGLSQNYVLSVVAFAAMGLGLSLLVPSIFAVSGNLVAEHRAGCLSFVSLLTAVPRILAPMAFGFVAGEFGMSLAFGLVAVGLAVALVLVLIFARGR